MLVGASKRSCCYWPSSTATRRTLSFYGTRAFDEDGVRVGQLSRRGDCSISIARLPTGRVAGSFKSQTTKHPKATSYATPSKEPVPALKDPRKQASKQDHRSAPPASSTCEEGGI